jgi:acyl-coenzyme A thioesterase PaaI-like protein
MVPWWFNGGKLASWRASQRLLLWHSQQITTNTVQLFSWSALLVISSWFCANALSVEQNRPITREFMMSATLRSPRTRVECSNHLDVDEVKTDGDNASVWYSSDGTCYKRMEIPPRAEESSHVIFGHLLQQPDLLKRYEIYRRVAPKTKNASCDSNGANGANDSPLVIAFVDFGHSLDGHPGIVHGGILAMMLDDVMGFGFWALGISMAVTANLSIDYRQPVMAGSGVKVNVYLTGQEGRKLYWKAQMTSLDDRIVYNEATSIYVIPKTFATATKKN